MFNSSHVHFISSEMIQVTDVSIEFEPLSNTVVKDDSYTMDYLKVRLSVFDLCGAKTYRIIAA